MPLPLFPLAAAALLVMLSGSGGKEEAPVWNADELQPGTKVFLATHTDPTEFYAASYASYASGFPKDAAALLSACNYYRQQRQLPALPYPPDAATLATLQPDQIEQSKPGGFGHPGETPPVIVPPAGSGLPNVQTIPPVAGMTPDQLFGKGGPLAPFLGGGALPGGVAGQPGPTQANPHPWIGGAKPIESGPIFGQLGTILGAPPPSGQQGSPPAPGGNAWPFGGLGALGGLGQPTQGQPAQGQPASPWQWPGGTTPPPPPPGGMTFPLGGLGGLFGQPGAGTGPLVSGQALGFPAGGWVAASGNAHHVLQSGEWGISPIAKHWGRSDAEAHDLLGLNPGSKWGAGGNIHPGDDLQVPNAWALAKTGGKPLSPTTPPAGATGVTFSQDGQSPTGSAKAPAGPGGVPGGQSWIPGFTPPPPPPPGGVPSQAYGYGPDGQPITVTPVDAQGNPMNLGWPSVLS